MVLTESTATADGLTLHERFYEERGGTAMLRENVCQVGLACVILIWCDDMYDSVMSPVIVVF